MDESWREGSKQGRKTWCWIGKYGAGCMYMYVRCGEMGSVRRVEEWEAEQPQAQVGGMTG